MTVKKILNVVPFNYLFNDNINTLFSNCPLTYNATNTPITKYVVSEWTLMS